jgi:hypothetical protein
MAGHAQSGHQQIEGMPAREWRGGDLPAQGVEAHVGRIARGGDLVGRLCDAGDEARRENAKCQEGERARRPRPPGCGRIRCQAELRH